MMTDKLNTMFPDKEIVRKLNALADDFRDEAEQYLIEANRARDNDDLKDYFILLRKYGDNTKQQIEVLMEQLRITESAYDEMIRERYK